MGLADFLAEAGRNTAIGQVAQAFGGQTTGQKNLDTYINNDLPALAQEIQANTDETKIPALQTKFIQTSLKAGLPMQAVDKLSEMLIGPHLQGMRQDQLNKLRQDYGAQPAQPRPPGTEGPLTQSGNFVDPTAEKPLDLNFAMRLGQATGANPQQFREMLGTPADIAGKQLSNQKTQGEIDKEAVAARQRQGLSNVPQAPGQPSPQDIGILNPGALSNFLPMRDKPEDPLLEERRSLLAAQTGAANALAANRGQGGAGGQATTTSEHIVDPAKQADAGRQIAQAAKERGMTSPEQIRQIADDFGYTIEGNPTIEDNLLSAFGVSNARLGGTYRLTPKDVTKTVTKGASAPSGQGRYSQGVPSGSAPVPAQGPQAPPIGTISKGYRFKGGNPADQKNWVKVQ